VVAGLVGQERVVETLRRATERPSHAYLLVGPRGSGVEEAARDFAALLIGVGDDERGLRLVERGVHPDVVEFAPGGPSYRVKEDVRDSILPEAARAPIEADRRVLILFEAERLRGNQNESANAMLKTIEEPPPRTIVMLVTAVADDLLPTIRSRCQRIDFDPVGDDALSAALAQQSSQQDHGGDLTSDPIFWIVLGGSVLVVAGVAIGLGVGLSQDPGTAPAMPGPSGVVVSALAF